MSKNPFGRIGLIGTLSQDAWPDSFVRPAAAGLEQAHRALEAMGFEVVQCGELARTWTEMGAQSKQLAAEGVNALVLFANTWTYANGAVLTAIECPVPIIIWAEATAGRYGICGAGVLKGSLDEIGACCSLVYGCVNEPETLAQVRDLCLGATAATRLRGLRFGLGGTCSMGMYTALVDACQWSRQFGIVVDGFEQVELIRRAERISDSDAQSVLRWMKETFGRVDPPDAVMLHQIKLYLALKQMVQQNGYDFIAVKCLPELPACHTTLCLAHALLNSTMDASGPKDTTVCGCEADVNGALTMQLLKHITGEAALFADVLHLDRKDKLLSLANCGSQTVDFAACPKDVWWMKESMPQFTWKIGCTHPQYVSRPGRMTLARLSRVKGKFVMLIAEGEALALSREKLRETNDHIAQTFVRLDASADDFVKHLRSNHLHAVYGSVSRPLLESCRVLDVEAITI
jgi:L-fucose/D-arabinose isomerase